MTPEQEKELDARLRALEAALRARTAAQRAEGRLSKQIAELVDGLPEIGDRPAA